MKYIMYKNRKIATLEQVDNESSKYNGMWRVEILSAQKCWFNLATKHCESEKEARLWAIKNRDTSREA
jgi:hypothetical protein